MKKPKAVEEIVTTGRRKTAVASIRLRPGTGNIDINGRGFENYLTQEMDRRAILSPFRDPQSAKNYDMIFRVSGGGIEGQVIAMRLGLARALVQEDETRRHDLKTAGFLTRDSRKRERKKYGQPGARKRFQFSKR